MTTPNSSDYMEIKKRKQLSVCNPSPTSSSYTANKQYLILQTTAVTNGDGCLQKSDRFQIYLPSNDLATLVQPDRTITEKPLINFHMQTYS